ncbi:MAG: amidohydrolase family protein [Candidatus Latescibacteria bacterium]|nr:amidohydrolase family protein [Candidatus Latescibacterota bacterium]
MQIIDAHHHLWDRGRFIYSWLKERPPIDRDYLLRDYEEAIQGSGVVKSVFVQAGVDEPFAMQEARWALSMAQGSGPVAGVVAWAPVERPDLEDYLEKLGEDDHLKGIRRLIQGEADDFCARPEFVAGVEKVAARGLSFDLCIYHPQLAAAVELVRQVPQASFVLDHIGKPGIKEGLMEPWSRQIGELAQLDNVVCKLSGLVTEADLDNWTPQDLRPYIERVVEVFGYDRLMFGSDWPVSTLAASYDRWLEVVYQALEGASQAEKEQVLQGTAARFYQL